MAESSNPTVRKQIAKGKAILLVLEASCCKEPVARLLARNISSSFTLAFGNKPMLVPADLVELIFTPEKAAANFSLETQTSLCLSTLVIVVQKGAWLFYN